MTYVPLTYLQDMEALIRALELRRFVLFGTSLGGLITSLVAMSDNSRLAGVLINDIGPVIERSGIDHIRSYVGRSQTWPTWLHAARALGEANRQRYPAWQLDQWLVFAKRICRLSSAGRIVLDYDMRVSEPFKLPGGATGFDMWTAFAALNGMPSLLVRGEVSDLLSAETVEAMEAQNPDLESVTVSGVGHAPTLEEPEAVAAIDRLLGRVNV
jgi:pimeloyl-ACP methyl ester carboxylesterase